MDKLPRQSGASTYFLTRALFVRGLGVIYLVAFASLGVQIRGLSGENGVVPAAKVLEFKHSQLGSDAYWSVPTLAWLKSSDDFLQFLCYGGAILSVLVILRIRPGPILLVLWVFYLSLYGCCVPFMNFQWDILLLETGFLGVFFASWRLWPRGSTDPAPSRMILWLIRLLLFKLMFFSGVVKLDSKDEVWWNLTALSVHYETQPLASPLAWYAHQLPEEFQIVCCGVMFVIELVVPFLIFTTRWLRQFAFFSLIILMCAIILTGNYTFFNFLTMLLCISLVDDTFLLSFVPKRFATSLAVHRPLKRRQLWRIAPLALISTVIILLGTFLSINRLTIRMELRKYALWRHTEKVFGSVQQWIGPFHVANNYGLFANMTENRPEIVIEGSNDGREWQVYEFKWKPGDLSRVPGVVAPHQPRLDWQMWFAALNKRRNNWWFRRLTSQLLEGSEQVLTLLEHNPFPDAPPRYVRALLYDYRFTDWSEREESGHWWRRELIGVYQRPMSLSARRPAR